MRRLFPRRNHPPSPGPRTASPHPGALALAAISTGLFLSASFPKLSWYPLAWIAWVPLLWTIPHVSPGGAFRLGFLAGLVHAGTALYWIAYVVQRYGGLPLPVALSVLLLLCAYLALYPAAFAWIARRWLSRPAWWAWGLAPAWVALEWVRAHLFTGFPWTQLGYTQTPLLPLIQMADVTGVYGISWLVVQANAAVLIGWRYKNIRPALAVFLCAGVALAYGSWRLQTGNDAAGTAEEFRVGLVQGNIDQSVKWDPAYQAKTLDTYEELSRQLVRRNQPDLVVWPETAAPFFYDLEAGPTARLHEILEALKTPLLVGIPGIVRMEGAPKLQNQALLLEPSRGVTGRYSKRHLVPFGEYVPLKKVLFFVEKLVAAAGDFQPGKEPAALPLGRHVLGVLICYEAIFPELARDEVRRGATVLVNLTNDAWFGDSSAPYQHKEMARWRAVEFRVPFVRCANTGISAVFAPSGKTLADLPLNTRSTLSATLPPPGPITFYARFGDVFAWLCTLTTATLGVYGALRNRRTP
ncbi:MAG: lnt [Desulfacinum sp.]|nr:lnt [Desulfacinum sp.]